MWMPRHEPRATRKIRLLEITNFYRQKDGHEQRPAQYWGDERTMLSGN